MNASFQLPGKEITFRPSMHDAAIGCGAGGAECDILKNISPNVVTTTFSAEAKPYTASPYMPAKGQTVRVLAEGPLKGVGG